MSNPTLRILEDQVDTLAGRLAEAEKRAERLLELFSKPPVLERLGLEAWQVKDIGRVVSGGSLAASQH